MLLIYFKLLLVFVVLLIASFLDVKKREVSNKFWNISTLVLSPFILHDLYCYGIWYRFLWLYSLLFTFLLSYLFWKLNFFGGADVKCLLFLSCAFPFLVNVPSLIFFDNYAFKIYLALKAVLPVPVMVLFLSAIFRLFYEGLFSIRHSYPFLPFMFVSFVILVLVG